MSLFPLKTFRRLKMFVLSFCKIFSSYFNLASYLAMNRPIQNQVRFKIKFCPSQATGDKFLPTPPLCEQYMGTHEVAFHGGQIRTTAESGGCSADVQRISSGCPADVRSCPPILISGGHFKVLTTELFDAEICGRLRTMILSNRLSVGQLFAANIYPPRTVVRPDIR